MITTKEIYLARVQLAKDADELNGVHEDAKADTQRLHSTDQDEIGDAIKARFGELNAAALPPLEQKPRWGTGAPVRRGCKHLIAIAILLTLSLAASARFSCCALVPTANGNAGDLTARRLAALSQVESGDDDNAIGRAGEVSRFQIMPDVFAKYFFVVSEGRLQRPPPDVAARRLHAAARNPFTAWHVARSVMQDRCSMFAARFHRDPSDVEFYILWARPSWLLQTNRIDREKIMADRAQRFANLVNR